MEAIETDLFICNPETFSSMLYLLIQREINESKSREGCSLWTLQASMVALLAQTRSLVTQY